ncbi:hypothetical protein PR202_gb13008 [Eleusine coracana subsp. coracana]|uniref:DUF4220 domain-containing protein n=1 Tax=Eleusine coracana subsp. coracana TaxID=191504 RepID=A0AAV5EPC5_ELECO|nr:hypothetical protein PR202_gb13008 [Eleusine coracana subsp. coracana]
MVPAIEELWNAWEIHCLILVSLFLQVFLFLFGGMRRRSSDWLLRSVLWFAYVSADSMAVFVLGHLAVHASQPRHQLMSFWAPFILVHLGGQDTISAFSKEDNELWGRHLLNLVTQVAVAGYVVVKASWPDRRLFVAMVLMFLCGCYKYGEHTIILYSANPEQLREWSNDVQSKKETVIGNVDFPTSMLIWHIATDICYHFGGTDCDQLKKKKQISRELSNYIMYLVFKCGVMLTTNSQLVHDNTYEEIVEIFRPLSLRLSEKDIVMKLFEAKKNKHDLRDRIHIEHEESKGQKQSMDEIKIELEESENNDNAADNHIKKILANSKTLKSPVLPRACVVAQELIRIKDEADR